MLIAGKAILQNHKIDYYGRIKQMLLRDCVVRNTEFCYGIVVYTGHNTKIMKNAKKPPTKVSNVLKLMNYFLYSVTLTI